ncbi:MAG: alpha/beta hydrolase [Candidatus Woesearchaeota archaeon]|nr:MAG: alpha/beta hydrolase [Candidatus Woesearchaeota archaeon]
MEIVTFENSRNKTLVGTLYQADSKAVIVMSHAFASDRTKEGFDTIAGALKTAQYNVLTFDFSGCGDSESDTLTIGKQVDDLYSAIEYVKKLGCQKIGLFGYSLGGLVSLKSYNKDVETIVLTSPVTDKIKYTWDKRYTPEQLKKLYDKGYITKVKEDGVKRVILVDKQMLKDRESVNQEELLRNVACPVLILHGNKDNRVPLEDSIAAIEYLPSESKLEIVDGMDHYLHKHLNIITNKTVSWFEEHL